MSEMENGEHRMRGLVVPTGWVETRFGEIFELSYGKGLPERIRNAYGKYPVYGSNGIVGFHDSFLIEGPAVIVGRKGTAGTVAFSLRACWPIDTTYYVRRSNHVDVRFSFHLLSSIRLNQFERSTAVPGLNRNDVYRLSVCLPPFSEQRRIGAKIDELFSELDAGIESLKSARAQLATYRQAVLKHAFEGKLTARWHEMHGNVPGGRGLLQQILAERRIARETSRLGQPYAKTQARRVNGEFVYKEPATPFASALPSIPESWCWATVDQLLTDPLSNGRSVKSAESGFPVLRLTALRNGEVEQDECKIGAWTKEDAQQFLVRQGDILVARGNGSIKLVGMGGLVRRLKSPVAYPDTMIRVRLSRRVNREFFCFVWNSQIVRTQIEEKARTTAGIFKVNQQDLKTTVIPLPPLEEQIVIVDEIRGGLAAIEHASALIDSQLSTAVVLRQSILKRALCGRLVPQDGTDEPASVLLERIKGERAQAASKATRKTGKWKKTIVTV